VRATSGAAQLVTVVAEPGIGKSRLLDELRVQLSDEVTWLQGACAPYGDANALAAMQMVIRDLVGVGVGEDAAKVDDALSALIERPSRPSPNGSGCGAGSRCWPSRRATTMPTARCR
jgi:predicted ATPase